MKKQFKEILKNSKISVKWKNFGSWTKEDVNNLLEAAQSRRIKITGTANNLTITCNNNVKIVRKSNATSLERDLLMVLKMFYVYLGDETKIYSRFGTSSLNRRK